MSKHSNAKSYTRMAGKLFEEIARLPKTPENEVVFQRLKKKLNKYVQFVKREIAQNGK